MLYVVGCDDVVYEGRVVVRERPLLALDAVSGRQLWEVDLLPFGNDMGCEPAKPSLLSPGVHLPFASTACFPADCSRSSPIRLRRFSGGGHRQLPTQALLLALYPHNDR